MELSSGDSAADADGPCCYKIHLQSHNPQNRPCNEDIVKVLLPRQNQGKCEIVCGLVNIRSDLLSRSRLNPQSKTVTLLDLNKTHFPNSCASSGLQFYIAFSTLVSNIRSSPSCSLPVQNAQPSPPIILRFLTWEGAAPPEYGHSLEPFFKHHRNGIIATQRSIKTWLWSRKYSIRSSYINCSLVHFTQAHACNVNHRKAITMVELELMRSDKRNAINSSRMLFTMIRHEPGDFTFITKASTSDAVDFDRLELKKRSPAVVVTARPNQGIYNLQWPKGP